MIHDPAQFADVVSRLTDEEVLVMHQRLLEIDKASQREKWQNLFPDEGEFPRRGYPKHIEFFKAGATHRERLALFGNRTGKTVCAGFEVSCHLTGIYPHWWEGRVFDKPIDAWVAGDTNETTRDIIQKTLLGDVAWEGTTKGFDGVGIIPYDRHGFAKFKPNTGDLLDYIKIKHEQGGWSTLAFKSYDQGRRVFQGTAKSLIWLDEECPMDVYGECLIRTATTDGIVLLTFTPLNGMSEVVRSFLSPETGGMVDA